MNLKVKYLKFNNSEWKTLNGIMEGATNTDEGDY